MICVQLLLITSLIIHLSFYEAQTYALLLLLSRFLVYIISLRQKALTISVSASCVCYCSECFQVFFYNYHHAILAFCRADILSLYPQCEHPVQIFKVEGVTSTIFPLIHT